MPIAVSCLTCGKKLKAPDGSAGKNVKCPKCGARMVVPADALPPQAENLRFEPERNMEDDEPPRPSERRSPARRSDDEYEDDDDRRPQHIVHHHHAEKSGGTAVVLEILPGLLIQTFGIGHMYAGHVGIGLAFMFGYWAILAVNILLCFFCIGWVTLTLCWVGTVIFSSMWVSRYRLTG